MRLSKLHATGNDFLVADAHGRVTCFNAAAARITAVRPADALGQMLDKALPLEDLEGRRTTGKLLLLP